TTPSTPVTPTTPTTPSNPSTVDDDTPLINIPGPIGVISDIFGGLNNIQFGFDWSIPFGSWSGSGSNNSGGSGSNNGGSNNSNLGDDNSDIGQQPTTTIPTFVCPPANELTPTFFAN